jgi:periodic tryptophan protein 1
MASNTIITSLFWVKKGWARSIPLEYEEVNNIENDPKFKKVSKIKKKLEIEGKLTGNETIKESAKLIEEKMNVDEEDLQAPIFSEDLKNYYMKEDNEENNNNEDMDVDEKGEKNEIKNLPDHFDDISDEEQEDFTIHPNDSLIVCGTAQDDFSNLEIYIYNENDLDLYVHHDIALSSFPLSLEWIPFKNNKKCNYALVGSFTPGIEIWNLDIMDAIEPEIILGLNTESKNKLQKNISEELYHTDAVMSICLNNANSNYVASSGADKKVLIWDLNASPSCASTCYKEHNDKVQSVKWNKIEENLLVTGSFDKSIKIFDTRVNKSVFTYKINSDIECIDWSELDKYKMLFSFEDGRIQLFDLQQFAPIISFKAHKKEATSVAFSPQQKSLFASCGRDGRIKIFDYNKIEKDDNNDNMPNLIMEKYIKKSVGELFTVKFAEDCDNTIAAGGSKGELFIWQLEESPIFCSQYGIKFNDNVENQEHFKNIPNKKRGAFKEVKKNK